MTGTLIAFSLSFLGIVAVFAHKAFEIKKGASFVPSSLRTKSDALLEAALGEQKERIIAKIARTTRAFLMAMKRTIHDLFLLVLHILHDTISKLLERMKKSRGFRKNKGSVSFFLQNVSEYKEEIKESVEK